MHCTALSTVYFHSVISIYPFIIRIQKQTVLT